MSIIDAHTESELGRLSQEDCHETQESFPSHFDDEMECLEWTAPTMRSSPDEDKITGSLQSQLPSETEEPSPKTDAQCEHACTFERLEPQHDTSGIVVDTAPSSVRVEQELSAITEPPSGSTSFKTARPNDKRTSNRQKPGRSSSLDPGVDKASHIPRQRITRSQTRPWLPVRRYSLYRTATASSASTFDQNKVHAAVSTESQTRRKLPDRRPAQGDHKPKRGIFYEDISNGLTQINCSVPNCTKKTRVDTRDFKKWKKRSPWLLSERYFPHDNGCRRELLRKWSIPKEDLSSVCLLRSRPHIVSGFTSIRSMKEYQCSLAECFRITKKGRASGCRLEDFVVDSASA